MGWSIWDQLTEPRLNTVNGSRKTAEGEEDLPWMRDDEHLWDGWDAPVPAESEDAFDDTPDHEKPWLVRFLQSMKTAEYNWDDPGWNGEPDDGTPYSWDDGEGDESYEDWWGPQAPITQQNMENGYTASLQDRYATVRRIAKLRHFAADEDIDDDHMEDDDQRKVVGSSHCDICDTDGHSTDEHNGDEDGAYNEDGKWVSSSNADGSSRRRPLGSVDGEMDTHTTEPTAGGSSGGGAIYDVSNYPTYDRTYQVTEPKAAAYKAAALNDDMDFDHVIEVHADGSVTDARGVYAPELYDDELMGDGWELMDGYSGQDRYSGPIMHNSEFIGGQMEQDILANPGYYVALVNNSSEDEEGEGWAVAYKPTSTTASKTASAYVTNDKGEEFAWSYEADNEEPGTVVVYLLDPDTEEIVDALGGVDVPSMQISDHGNTNVSPDDENYLEETARQMASDFRTASKTVETDTQMSFPPEDDEILGGDPKDEAQKTAKTAGYVVFDAATNTIYDGPFEDKAVANEALYRASQGSAGFLSESLTVKESPDQLSGLPISAW
jgi:hypothetical protein